MKKVLVVEDDVDTLDLVELILQDNGYAVTTANKQVTIEEIISIEPDLIILDFLLPFVLGSELCLEIKSNPLTEHIAVMLYSASSGVDKLARDCKADAYLAKPFDLDELLKLVDEICQSSAIKPDNLEV